MSLVTVRSALLEILPALLEVIGEDQVRSVSRRAQELVGEGGNVKEWLTAMGVAVAELDDPNAEAAFLAALGRL